MTFKDLIPPIIIRSIKNRAVKEYDSYDRALADCTKGGYQNAELCDMIADKTSLYSKNLSKKPYAMNPSAIFLISAINRHILEFSVDRINILDVGGGAVSIILKPKYFTLNVLFLIGMLLKRLKWYYLPKRRKLVIQSYGLLPM